ncbi:MAG TPA: hypothetical protein VIJ79_07945 [Acidobacteriaceae bacterium]
MELAHEQHGHMDDAHSVAHRYGPRTLPAVLDAPPMVAVWRKRMVVIAIVATLVSLIFIFFPLGKVHMLRAYLLGWMTAFTFAGGGLCMLMLQYVSGGKWGLLLRRPLEAMSRTLWLVAVLFIPIAFWMKKLYLWANYSSNAAAFDAMRHSVITEEEALTANAKRTMLSPHAFIYQTIVIFAVFIVIAYFLQKWSMDRDADPAAGTQRSYDRWRMKSENLSGIGILIYVILMTVGAIIWIMSLDVTWYSSIWGLQFLVGQGYAVLALGILTVVLLSKAEPMKTLLRMTEQHDLGKFLFAFVMLNIYLNFAEYLIIWSGNIPDEIPWYLNRTTGGWWIICALDFIFHWVIPFVLLLSRDLKRSKIKMIWLCSFMVFARVFDMFWLIEPNFRDSARNLHFSVGILAYITVPVAVLAVWAVYYLTLLMDRPLMNTNDPHLAEMLEPEHAH